MVADHANSLLMHIRSFSVHINIFNFNQGHYEKKEKPKSKVTSGSKQKTKVAFSYVIHGLLHVFINLNKSSTASAG